MSKITYFSLPLCMNSRKFVRFAWSGNLYEFLCLYFGLQPAPRMFLKLLKVSIAPLRRLNIHLVMGRTLEEILMSRDTLIFLLQHLGFAINLKKKKKTVLKSRALRIRNLYIFSRAPNNIFAYTFVQLIFRVPQIVIRARQYGNVYLAVHLLKR